MDKILSAMADFGLSVGSIRADGQIHRCHSSAKKRRNHDGWYMIKSHGDHFYAVFGCWIRWEKRKASTSDGEGDYAKTAKAWRELEESHAAAEMEKLAKAKKTVREYLEKFTKPADQDHEYLLSKGVEVYGNLRQYRDTLILPVLNVNGEATSYQTITANGRKKFLYQGVVKGGCFPIPGNDLSTICICEGYATGATIREATGFKVLVAFNAGNMIQVARQAGHRFSGREILVCADNDHGKEKNAGIEAAKRIRTELGFGFVYPTGINGTDFNDMAAEIGMDAVRGAIFARHTIECMEQSDCYEIDESLIIPSGLTFPGLIGQGLDALEGDIIQYSLPLVLTAISRAIAGKIAINNVWPNVFNIRVGGTSTGKTATDKKFVLALDIPDFISMNDVASGAGVWRSVADNPRGMGMFDEVTSLFVRHNSKGGTDVNAEQKSAALCDLYTRSGTRFNKPYGDNKNKVMIESPCVSLIGNATPTIFEAIQPRDFETGLMQRFDFWVYGGKIRPKPLIIGSSYKEKTRRWISELKKLMELRPVAETLASVICECVDLDATDDAQRAISDLSVSVVDEANRMDSDGYTGFVSRKFDLSLKYALIHHAAIHGAERLYEPVNLDDIQWGIAIAQMLCDWKINVLGTKVVSGEFHKDCELFKSAILASTKSGRKPSFRYMASRRAALKNWQPRYSESIIQVLTKRGEIIQKEGRDGTTLYHLPKKK